MSEEKKEMEKHNVRIRTGIVDVYVYRDQRIVERFNRKLSERLFSYKHSKEINMKSSERFREWVTKEAFGSG